MQTGTGLAQPTSTGGSKLVKDNLDESLATLAGNLAVSPGTVNKYVYYDVDVFA